MQILEGLHQLRVPIPNNPIGYVMPYLFEVPGGVSIIDPGWNADESIESLRGQMQALGLGFSDIKQLIVTHIHPDHYGMAGRLRELSGAEVIVHEKDLEFMNWRRGVQTMFDESWLARLGMPEEEARWQFPGGFRLQQTEPDSTMTDGQILELGRFQLMVIWTPGHSPGHACFYDAENQLMFSGDHVLPTISPNVSYIPGREEDPLASYLSSLARLKGFPTRRVLPAHQYSFDDLPKRLDELEEHHELRLQEMLAAVEDGADTAYDVARRVKWNVGSFEDFSPGTRRAATTETLAHLSYLVNQGRLDREDRDGLTRYRR